MFSQEISAKIQNTSFFVTGGAGFIGSNLVKALLENQAKQVIVFDDLSTGFESNISEFSDQPNFSFIKGSITDLDLLTEHMKEIDVVFQLAALGSVPRSIDNPGPTNQVNVTGFMNVLIAAKTCQVDKIIYSSSSSVYGDDTTIPKIESNTGHPLSPYAVTKKTNELYAEAFSKVYDMDIIGLRYFNVFGPKQNIKGAYAAVIPIFIANLLQGKPCYINGDGQISRDFTHVSNVVSANLLAAFADMVAKHSVYNIAMGDQLSLNDLYRTLEGDIKTGLEPVHREKRLGDIQNSQADISKAQAELNYKPMIKTNDGLLETIQWYKSQLVH